MRVSRTRIRMTEPGARERKISWGQSNRRRRWRRDRDTEGVEVEAPKAPRLRRRWRRGGEVWGGGFPSPSDYGVWGSVVSSPSGVRGGARRKTIWCILMPSEGRWFQKFTKFCSVSSNAELRKLHKHRQDNTLNCC